MLCSHSSTPYTISRCPRPSSRLHFFVHLDALTWSLVCGGVLSYYWHQRQVERWRGPAWVSILRWDAGTRASDKLVHWFTATRTGLSFLCLLVAFFPTGEKIVLPWPLEGGGVWRLRQQYYSTHGTVPGSAVPLHSSHYLYSLPVDS